MQDRYFIRLALAVVLATLLVPNVEGGGVYCPTLLLCQPINAWRLAASLRGGGNEGGEEANGKEKDEALIQQLQGMRNEIAAITDRINSIEAEIEGHILAKDVLKDYDASRPCHRAIGGVLTEQTVGTVLPAVDSELTMLNKARGELLKLLRESEDEMSKFQAKNGIRILRDPNMLPQFSRP